MADREAGLGRARRMETSNQPQGRTGSGTKKNRGPAAKRGVLPGNPTKGGGINRPTKSR